MAFLDRFTDDEQLLLAATPTLIGSVMAFAASSGLGTIKEMMASTRTYLGGLESYPENEIIQGVLPNLDDRKEALTQAKTFRAKTLERLKAKGVDSKASLRALLIDDTKMVHALLAEKATPGEASEYRAWAMAVAGNVAKAAKEGGFLGIGGERVSDDEKTLFTELAEALGGEDQLS